MLAAFAFANLKHDIDAVFGWLSHRSFWQLMFMAALLLAGWEYLGKSMEQRHAHKLQTQLSKVVKARADDRAAYSKAQAAAHVQNIAQVQRIEQQQQKVTDDVETHYRADLARLRAERGNVQPANPASQRPADKPGSSPLSAAPSGPRCEALSLPPAELLRAQETELQLNALIDWTLQQSTIDPNKP